MILESKAFTDNEPMSLASYVSRVEIIATHLKDVKAATTLRLSRARGLDTGGTRMMLLGIRPLVTDKKLEQLNCTSDRALWRLAQEVGREMLSNPSAQWWKENKDKKHYHNIAESTKIVLARFTKIRPFG